MKEAALSPAQNMEWMAWRLFCKRFFETTGIDIDHERCNGMVDAIKLWGEELVELRREHPLPLETLNRMRRESPLHSD